MGLHFSWEKIKARIVGAGITRSLGLGTGEELQNPGRLRGRCFVNQAVSCRASPLFCVLFCLMPTAPTLRSRIASA